MSLLLITIDAVTKSFEYYDIRNTENSYIDHELINIVHFVTNLYEPISHNIVFVFKTNPELCEYFILNETSIIAELSLSIFVKTNTDITKKKSHLRQMKYPKLYAEINRLLITFFRSLNYKQKYFDFVRYDESFKKIVMPRWIERLQTLEVDVLNECVDEVNIEPVSSIGQELNRNSPDLVCTAGSVPLQTMPIIKHEKCISETLSSNVKKTILDESCQENTSDKASPLIRESTNYYIPLLKYKMNGDKTINKRNRIIPIRKNRHVVLATSRNQFKRLLSYPILLGLLALSFLGFGGLLIFVLLYIGIREFNKKNKAEKFVPVYTESK